jgi:hypothetical protein
VKTAHFPGGLEAYYAVLQAGMPIRDCPVYRSLVVPNGNQDSSVHRWFHLKEAYSLQLLDRVLDDAALAGRIGLRILDPFAGVGTTAISVADRLAGGRLQTATVYGIESNGFLHLVASTKLEALQRPTRTFARFALKIAKMALASPEPAPHIPSLSTLQKREYFDQGDVEQLMRLRQAIDMAATEGAVPLDVALARVCLGAVVETVSNLRRDGRALRFTEKRYRPGTVEAFQAKARQVVADIPARSVPVRGRILRGDGRLLEGIDERYRPFDLIIFSPPYPNNIDYTEVYKLENWVLGFISSNDAFVAQRLRTVYSHPSVLRPAPLPSDLLSESENSALANLVGPLLDTIPTDRYAEGRRRMVSGYARDMYLTLRAAKERLAAGGQIVYVVGNSVHGHGPGRMIIAADLLIAAFGELAGLEVRQVSVARHLRRREVASDYLRESVVFLAHAN